MEKVTIQQVHEYLTNQVKKQTFHLFQDGLMRFVNGNSIVDLRSEAELKKHIEKVPYEAGQMVEAMDRNTGKTSVFYHYDDRFYLTKEKEGVARTRAQLANFRTV